jgi:hypothetical protein
MDENSQYIEDLLKDENDVELNSEIKERIIKILKDLEDQKRQISELKAQNQLLIQSNGAMSSRLNKSKMDIDNAEEAPSGRGHMVEAAILTEGDYVAMDDFRDIVYKFEKVNGEFKETKTKLEKEVFDLQDVASDLGSLVEKLKNENHGLKDSINYMDEIHSSLRKQIDNFQIREEGFTISNDNLKKELDTLIQDLVSKEKENRELTELNQTLHKEFQEIGDHQSDSEHQKVLTKYLSEENSELAKRIEILEEIESKRDVVIDKNVKELLDTKSKRLEKLENELSKLLKESRMLNKELADWKGKHVSLKENYDELVEKLSTSNKLVNGMKALINNLRNQGTNTKLGKQNTTQAVLKNKPSNIDVNNPVLHHKVQSSLKTDADAQKRSPRSKVITKADLSKAKFKDDLKKMKEANHHSAKEPREGELLPIARNSLRDDKEISQANFSSKLNKNTMSNIIQSNDEQTIKGKTKAQLQPSETQLYADLICPNYSILEDEYNSQGSKENEKNQFSEGQSENQFNQIDDVDVDNVVIEFLRRQDTNLHDTSKVTLNRAVQTDYFSVVSYILENEDEIRENELDLEKIKDAVDILADMIGFNGVEDYTKLTEIQNNENTFNVPAASEKNGHKKFPGLSKNHDSKSQLPKKNAKVINSKTTHPRNITKLVTEHDAPKEKENFPSINVFEEDHQAAEAKKHFKLSSKKVTTRVKVEKEEVIQDLSDDQDHIIQKSKLVRNTYNKNEILEVIEYIRVPKELSIIKHNAPIIANKTLTDQEYTELKRISNQSAVNTSTYENELVEREKLYFRIYINIKQRYQFRPEKFLKIFKLTFNKVPEFESRLNDSYNPKTFLFNFEEFKGYFKQILHNHQYCGRYCVHFSQFYNKMGIINSHRHFHKMNSQYIDRLPGSHPEQSPMTIKN